MLNLKNDVSISTYVSCERCILSWEGRIVCCDIFLRMYVPLVLELCIDTFGFMAVDKIKKHLLGLSQTNIITLALVSE